MDGLRMPDAASPPRRTALCATVRPQLSRSGVYRRSAIRSTLARACAGFTGSVPGRRPLRRIAATTPTNGLCLHYWPGTFHSENCNLDGSFGQTPTYPVCLQTLACGVQSRSHWYMTGSRCQPEDRHVAIHAFPATGHRLVGFVPYADVASAGGFAHESAPGLKVRCRPVGREPLQMLRAPPVADHDGRPPEPLLVAQQSGLRCLGQVGKHLGHGRPHPCHFPEFPPPVGAHPNQEDCHRAASGIGSETSCVHLLRHGLLLFITPLQNSVL